MNTARRGHVLVAGSANLDLVVRVPHTPAPGETVLGGDVQTFPGGKGANQAVACARAGGAPTRMLVALGDDAAAGRLRASLQEAGVELAGKCVAGVATGMAFICIAGDGENSIVVAPGANNALQPGDLPALDGVSHLLLQLEIPLDSVTAYAERARADGVTVVLNAAPARALPPRLLEAVDLLVVNEGELTAIAGDAGGVEAALERVPVPRVVVTMGAQGCIARDGGVLLRQPAFPVQAVDTTAAGDTFCGVMVAALARGAALADALREASAASALACTTVGAQSSIPARETLLGFLRERTAPAAGGGGSVAARPASSAR